MLSDIDIQRAMHEKPGADMPPDRILGACNPPLAHQALQAEPDTGLLLPCNGIVREQVPGRVVVGFLDPQTMVGLVGKPGAKTAADEAEGRLRRVASALGGSGTLTVACIRPAQPAAALAAAARSRNRHGRGAGPQRLRHTLASQGCCSRGRPDGR